MPAIAGLLKTCLHVSDISAARDFYEPVLGLAAMFTDERMAAYDLGPASTLILFPQGTSLRPVAVPTGTIPPHDCAGPAHVAFAVDTTSLDDWRQALGAAEVAIESEIVWPQGGLSLYFRDPDDHLLELASPGLWRNYPLDLQDKP